MSQGGLDRSLPGPEHKVGRHERSRVQGRQARHQKPLGMAPAPWPPVHPRPQTHLAMSHWVLTSMGLRASGLPSLSLKRMGDTGLAGEGPDLRHCRPLRTSGLSSPQPLCCDASLVFGGEDLNLELTGASPVHFFHLPSRSKPFKHLWAF